MRRVCVCRGVGVGGSVEVEQQPERLFLSRKQSFHQQPLDLTKQKSTKIKNIFNVLVSAGRGGGAVIVVPVRFRSAAPEPSPLTPTPRLHGNHYVGQLASEHFEGIS